MQNLSTWLKLLGTTLIWALIFFMGRSALDIWSPAALGAWRFALAAVIIVPVALFTEGLDPQAIKQNFLSLVLMALVGITCFNFFLFKGIQHTSPVNGALIMALCPAFVTFLSATLLKTKLSHLHLLGLGVSLFGVTLVVLGGGGNGPSHSMGLSIQSGDFYILLACLCWAVYSTFPKKFIRGMSPLQIASVTIAIGAILNLITAMLTANDLFVQPTFHALLSLMGLSVFGVVLAFVWWQQSIKQLGAQKAAMAMNVTPLLTMLIGFALGQSIDMGQMLGGLFVLTGVWITTQLKDQTSRRLV